MIGPAPASADFTVSCESAPPTMTVEFADLPPGAFQVGPEIAHDGQRLNVRLIGSESESALVCAGPEPSLAAISQIVINYSRGGDGPVITDPWIGLNLLMPVAGTAAPPSLTVTGTLEAELKETTLEVIGAEGPDQLSFGNDAQGRLAGLLAPLGGGPSIDISLVGDPAMIRPRLFGEEGDDLVTADGPPFASGTAIGISASGGDGNDVLRGTDSVAERAGEPFGRSQPLLAGESISGGDGNDRIDLGGGAGHGEPGFDDLLSWDYADGGSGNDEIIGGPGAHEFQGGGGNDLLKTGPDVDLVTGQAGNDTIRTGGGEDRIDILKSDRKGRDTIYAGGGDDQVGLRDKKRDKLNCGGGRDRADADMNDKLRKCERATLGRPTPRSAE